MQNRVSAKDKRTFPPTEKVPGQKKKKKTGM